MNNTQRRPAYDPKVTTPAGTWTQITYYNSNYTELFGVTARRPGRTTEVEELGYYRNKSGAEAAARRFRCNIDLRLQDQRRARAVE